MTTLKQRTRLVNIEGACGHLESMVSEAQQSNCAYTMIICHPHPLHLGTMHNKVVTTLAKSGDLLNMHTIRFNFRGVAGSAGAFADGIGEAEDVLSVLQWSQAQNPQHEIILAGFSFGSYVACSVAGHINPKALITVAPAVTRQDYAHYPAFNGPWHVIFGEKDTLTPLEDAKRWIHQHTRKPKMSVIPDACHFFHGKLDMLERCITEHLTGVIA